MDKESILKLTEMSEATQRAWIGYYFKHQNNPCGHKGCINHISHPCENCGRFGACKPYTESLADLAFRLHNGTIAGKKPIEHIIDALIVQSEEKK